MHKEANKLRPVQRPSPRPAPDLQYLTAKKNETTGHFESFSFIFYDKNCASHSSHMQPQTSDSRKADHARQSISLSNGDNLRSEPFLNAFVWTESFNSCRRRCTSFHWCGQRNGACSGGTQDRICIDMLWHALTTVNNSATHVDPGPCFRSFQYSTWHMDIHLHQKYMCKNPWPKWAT